MKLKKFFALALAAATLALALTGLRLQGRRLR